MAPADAPEPSASLDPGTLSPLPFSLGPAAGSVEALPALRALYAQTLWLGEAHTPISSFLNALQRTDAPLDTPAALVRTPDEISQRFRCICDVHAPEEHEAYTFALEYGPVARLKDDPECLNAFLAAIKSRETQLQLVLVFWLLSKNPPQDTAQRPAPPRTAPITPAFWGNSPAPIPKKQDTTLQALLPALSDQLCLVQFSAELARGNAAPLYGSASRPNGQLDGRDEAQWLCADIIDPAFRHILPRQCAQLRAKCFVPDAGASPVRRIRLERVSSAPQEPPRRREKPLSAALEAERSIRTGQKPQAAREVHMGRRLVRSTSTGSVSGSALSTGARPVHKRKGQASRWGSQSQTLVAATPERPRHAPVHASPPSPSPVPMTLDSDESDDKDEHLVIPSWRKNASRLTFLQ